MSCFFGHKWTKWTRVNVEYIHWPKMRDGSLGPSVKYTKQMQKRECLKCGYIEEEEI